MILMTGSEARAGGRFATLLADAGAGKLPLAALQASSNRILGAEAGLNGSPGAPRGSGRTTRPRYHGRDGRSDAAAALGRGAGRRPAGRPRPGADAERARDVRPPDPQRQRGRPGDPRGRPRRSAAGRRLGRGRGRPGHRQQRRPRVLHAQGRPQHAELRLVQRRPRPVGLPAAGRASGSSSTAGSTCSSSRARSSSTSNRSSRRASATSRSGSRRSRRALAAEGLFDPASQAAAAAATRRRSR